MKKSYEIKLLLLLFLSLPLVSCSAMQETASTDRSVGRDISQVQMDKEKKNIESELFQTRSALMQKESDLARQKELTSLLESEVETAVSQIVDLEMEKERIAAQTQSMSKEPSVSQSVVVAPTLFPPNAKKGECYARVFVPSQYRTVAEKVLKKQAAERIEIIPAQYETVTETVLVKEASQQLEMVDAQYGWKEESVMVEPAKTVMNEVPAIYEMVSEEMLVHPAQVVWKKGTGPIQKIDNATGEILCLVEEPAEYKTVTKKVLKEPARIETTQIPPVFKTVKREVMLTPPSTRVVEIPAVYDNVQVTKMVRPSQQRYVEIPSEYQTVTKKELISDSRMEWLSILCQTNTTVEKISDIQRALSAAGFSPGPIDGIIGRRTTKAMNEFQQKKGLAVSKYLTAETMNALGVSMQ